jgi:hypothetical protein
VTATLHVVDHATRTISPRPPVRGGGTPYYRNVELSVRDGRFTLVDVSGTPVVLAADAIAWVVAGTGAPRLLILDRAGQVLA